MEPGGIHREIAEAWREHLNKYPWRYGKKKHRSFVQYFVCEWLDWDPWNPGVRREVEKDVRLPEEVE